MTIEQWKSVAGLVESFAKMVALAVGGTWTYMLFIRKRQQYPRASILHECTAYPLTADRSLLRVTLTVKNTSEVLLRIESGEVRVQRIGPLVWGEDVPAEGFVADGALEYNWPLLGRLRLSYPQDGCLEVEPGESEAIHHAAERAEARRTSGSGETKIGQRERTMQIKLAPGPPKLPPKPPPPQGPRKRREI